MSKSESGTIDALKNLVRGVGLRCTTARLAVLEQMLNASGPQTHAEVSAALDHRGFDRATIYRNLTELTEAKLVTRVDLGDHVWRFEAKRHKSGDGHGHGGDHPHFVCTSCGEVSCLDDVTVAITQRAVGDTPATATGGTAAPKAMNKSAPTAGRRRGIPAVTEVLLKGTCGNCE